MSRRLGKGAGGGLGPSSCRGFAEQCQLSKSPGRQDTLPIQAKEPLVGGVGEGAEVRSLGLQGAFPPHPGLGSEPRRQRDLS